MPKASKAEIEQRVAKLFEMITAGASTPFIIEYARKEWGICQANTYKYLVKARERVKDMVSRQYATALQEGIAVYDRIIQMALYQGTTKYDKEGNPYQDYDYHAARSAMAEKMKLMGFTQDTIEIYVNQMNEKHPDIAKMKVEELDKEYESLH